MDPGVLARGFMVLAMMAVVSVLCPARVAAAEAPAATTAPKMSAADIGLDIRYALFGNKVEGFALLEKEFTRHPRPHVEARYAQCLIGGKDWGAPDGQAERGLALAQEALRDGSLYALSVVGWQLLPGGQLPKDPVKGLGYLMKATGTDNPDAFSAVGDMYRSGAALPVNLNLAESWYLRAAYLGEPSGLHRLGAVYEAGSGSTPTNLAKACDLYYEASIRGCAPARAHLREIAAAGEPHAVRSERLVTLWLAAFGDAYNSKFVQNAANPLEKSPTEDAQVFLALGRLYASENAGYRNFKKAYGFFERAAKLGSLDARSERAFLLAEGLGVKRDQMLALAEWRTLERNGNAHAIGWLGYYQYWGALRGAQLPKDLGLAFSYSKKAADGGDLFGQQNVARCYEFGIGTPVDYGLAAKYYFIVARRGSLPEYEKVLKLINHLPR